MQSFTELKVWQKAHEFTLLIYKATANFPGEEKFGLTNQLRRAAVSIESNIADYIELRKVTTTIRLKHLYS